MPAAVDLAKPAVTWDDIVIRFLLAVALTGAIGVEREISAQPAGLRTHITLGLGAALFGLLSVHGFDAYVAGRNTNNYQIDVSRVASQVVVGVGFLGAGAILKEGRRSGASRRPPACGRAPRSAWRAASATTSRPSPRPWRSCCRSCFCARRAAGFAEGWRAACRR